MKHPEKIICTQLVSSTSIFLVKSALSKNILFNIKTNLFFYEIL